MIRWGLIVAGVGVLGCSAVFADEPLNDAEALRAAVSNQVVEVRKVAERMHRIRHDAEYKDPILAPLYKENREMEARLIENRARIQERLLQLEAYREARKTHEKAFRELRKLQEELRETTGTP